MRRFRRSFAIAPRRSHRWEWDRGIQTIAPAHPATNFDLLSSFKTHAGITINLPDIVIWRIRLRISISVTIAAAMAAADGVLITGMVDSLNQALLNQATNPYSEKHMLYSAEYLSHVPSEGGGNGAGTYFIERVYDIKAHRKMGSLDDTMFLQFTELGQANITGINVQWSSLLKRH